VTAREVVRHNLLAFRQRGGPAHAIFELPHISRKIAALKNTFSSRCQRPLRSMLFIESSQEFARQKNYVIRAIP
jgi:hypothetical protein